MPRGHVLYLIHETNTNLPILRLDRTCLYLRCTYYANCIVYIESLGRSSVSDCLANVTVSVVSVKPVWYKNRSEHVPLYRFYQLTKSCINDFVWISNGIASNFTGKFYTEPFSYCYKCLLSILRQLLFVHNMFWPYTIVHGYFHDKWVIASDICFSDVPQIFFNYAIYFTVKVLSWH